ncbi:hypothetical protein D3C72_2363980 [compost metagenome]
MVEREIVFAAFEVEVAQLGGGRDGAAHAAERAGAAPDGVEFVGQPDAEPHGPAVTGALVFHSLVAHRLALPVVCTRAR